MVVSTVWLCLLSRQNVIKLTLASAGRDREGEGARRGREACTLHKLNVGMHDWTVSLGMPSHYTGYGYASGVARSNSWSEREKVLLLHASHRAWVTKMHIQWWQEISHTSQSQNISWRIIHVNNMRPYIDIYWENCYLLMQLFCEVARTGGLAVLGSMSVAL